MSGFRAHLRFLVPCHLVALRALQAFLYPYQLGRHSRRSSRNCCPDPDCQPHCCCAPQGCRDHALSALGASALPLRGALAALRAAPPAARSPLALIPSGDIRRYAVSMTLPLRSTRKHSENAFPRPLCASPDSRSTDLHASWLLASGDGGASAAFDAAWAHTA